MTENAKKKKSMAKQAKNALTGVRTTVVKRVVVLAKVENLRSHTHLARCTNDGLPRRAQTFK